jgi:hypothetical protein
MSPGGSSVRPQNPVAARLAGNGGARVRRRHAKSTEPRRRDPARPRARPRDVRSGAPSAEPTTPTFPTRPRPRAARSGRGAGAGAAGQVPGETARAHVRFRPPPSQNSQKPQCSTRDATRPLACRVRRRRPDETNSSRRPRRLALCDWPTRPFASRRTRAARAVSLPDCPP